MNVNMKKVVSAILALLLISGTCSALAADGDNARVVIGADISSEHKDAVYSTFGIARGSVPELILTNSEEHAYLEGLVPDSVIGTLSISCVYVKIEPPGTGLNVTASNVTWCTKEMYVSAISTAGINDATIIVTAPFNVSGTAALGGIYKAYEDLTGQKIGEEAKLVSTQELVLTAELADEIGNYDAVTIVNELKIILEQTKDMTDDEVRAEIKQIAADNGISVTDGQVEQLLKLCRSLEGLDPEELQKRVETVQNAITGMSKVGETVSNIGRGVSNIIRAIGDFFSNLFGGGRRSA